MSYVCIRDTVTVPFVLLSVVIAPQPFSSFWELVARAYLTCIRPELSWLRGAGLTEQKCFQLMAELARRRGRLVNLRRWWVAARELRCDDNLLPSPSPSPYITVCPHLCFRPRVIKYCRNLSKAPKYSFATKYRKCDTLKSSKVQQTVTS